MDAENDDMKAGTIALTFGAALTLATPTHVRAEVATQGLIILAEGDCGRDYHRDDHGKCAPNWHDMEGRECPRGYHIGPDGKRCWPN
jgi:hypothetical protein